MGNNWNYDKGPESWVGLSDAEVDIMQVIQHVGNVRGFELRGGMQMEQKALANLLTPLIEQKLIMISGNLGEGFDRARFALTAKGRN